MFRNLTRILLIIIFISPCVLQSKKVSETEMQAIVSSQLERSPYAPQILGLSVYKERAGLVCRLDVSTNRNREKGHLILAFAALAKLAEQTAVPFQRFVVTLHFNQHNRLPDFWTCDAKATKARFVNNTIDLRTWLDRHVYQLQL